MHCACFNIFGDFYEVSNVPIEKFSYLRKTFLLRVLGVEAYNTEARDVLSEFNLLITKHSTKILVSMSLHSYLKIHENIRNTIPFQ